jgi:parallel beta-helix repeat protein
VKSVLRNVILAGLTFVLAIVVAATARAAGTFFVGTCVSPSFATIQAGVNAASAGSTVNVCPGTYPEQVTIDKRLTLQGITVGTANQAVVASPAGGVVANAISLATGNPLAAQISVHDTPGVTISNLTVDGSDNGITGCAPNLIGIYYQDASGTVSNVVARNQTAGLNNSPINECQWGMGIFVQSGVSTVTNKAGTSTVTVANSNVHDFQKNGITGNEVGTTVHVRLNQVRGEGPTSGAAENGIQIGFGATGNITNNSVIDEIYSPCVSLADCAATASGILIDDAAGVTTSNNHVGNTQGGVTVVSDGAFSSDDQAISGNVLNGTLVFDGIDLCGSNGGSISNNTVADSGRGAIHLDSTCTDIGGPAGGGANVSGNSLNEACAGILNGSNGNTISATNTFFNVINTILVGDSCAAPTSEMSQAEIKGSGRDRILAQPARP